MAERKRRSTPRKRTANTEPQAQPEVVRTYTVRRAFAHDGVFYTRQNAAAIAALPDSVRRGRIRSGNIVEHTAPVSAPAQPQE